MNLLKNVDGSWEEAKPRLRSDLDKIQRQLNALYAQVNAPVAATVTPPAVISSANTVTTFTNDPLTSVAVKPNSGLAGSGRITDPLYNTGIFSGVTVAAAGALTGDGTGGNPLAVSVDGTSIGINGSNQLTALVSGPQTVHIDLLSAGYRSLHTTPITIVAGIAGSVIIPLTAGFRITKPALSTSNASPTLTFVYGGTTLRWASDQAPGMATAWTNWYVTLGMVSATPSTSLGNQQQSRSLSLTGTADLPVGVPASPNYDIFGVGITVTYVVVTLP